LQEKIIYVPVIPGVPKSYVAYPIDYGMDYEDIWIQVKDGTKLHAWMMWRKGLDMDQVRELPLVIFFQENAGNMSMRLHFLRAVVHTLHCKVFIVSYRGYGESTGSPSELGLQKDVHATMGYLVQRDDYAPDRTIVMGRSLGGAVAVYTALHFKADISGLIVENTFTSIVDMAPQAIPPLRFLIGSGKPCSWLIRNKWDTLSRVRSLVDVPILFLVSTADEIVHPHHMLKLFQVHGKDPWSFHEFEDAAHMDCYHTHGHLYWPRVKSFMDSLINRDHRLE
jgi:fermentation-respiration switch protein FrsA (DUF1100 family)